MTIPHFKALDSPSHSRYNDFMFSPLFALLRVRQWIKNLFVFAPLLFSEHLFDKAALIQSVIAFIAFCFAASFNYLVNDLFDRESDRHHPKKKHRPLASGAVAVPIAFFLAGVLFIGGIGVASRVGIDVLLVVVGYLLLNLWYSMQLKHIVFVDVLTVALGFVLRLLAGTVAIDVAYSPWIFLCGFLLTFLLALSKRRQEIHLLTTLQQAPQQTRTVLQAYHLPTLDAMLIGIVIVTMLAYIFYTLFAQTSTARMILSAPLVGIGLFRYLYLLRDSTTPDDPTEILLSDRPLVVTLIGWIVTVSLILY
jgi:4-hydroxybenzoate polyprenyltransferase